MNSERLANHFVDYLFDQYRGSRHVRRIATWIGLVLKAVERLPRVSFSQRHVRQLGFTYKGRQFKARFNHRAGLRGGIEIVEVLAGRGSPEGRVAVSITSLDEAENVYRTLRKRLDKFITA